MLGLNFTYADCVATSERVSWRVRDIISEEDALDFTKPFLPDALVCHLKVLDFLSPGQQLALNQIVGNSYLNLFLFVEEYILTTMMTHAHSELFGDPDAMRALCRFVDEELKHQQLFRAFRDAFDRGFGHPCGVLSNAAEVAQVILSHSPLAVLLITLHIELMTQSHYTESVRGNVSLDPLFKKLLHSHWIEEAQHARIDMLELDKFATQATQDMRDTAMVEYGMILEALDGLLLHQAHLDQQSFIGVFPDGVPDGQADEMVRALHQCYRRTFLWSGMTNRQAVRVFKLVSPSRFEQISARTAEFQ